MRLDSAKKELAQKIRTSSIEFSIRVRLLLNGEGARAPDTESDPAIPIIQVVALPGRVGLPPYRGCPSLGRRGRGRDYHPVSDSRGETSSESGLSRQARCSRNVSSSRGQDIGRVGST